MERMKRGEEGINLTDCVRKLNIEAVEVKR